MKGWEQEVRRQTVDLWQDAAIASQVARARDDILVVLRRVGDLVIFACGKVFHFAGCCRVTGTCFDTAKLLPLHPNRTIMTS